MLSLTLRDMCLFFFFFQAEDGIRDLVRSRGLGDVYKRQPGYRLDHDFLDFLLMLAGNQHPGRPVAGLAAVEPVSYTHLTLPTSGLVLISVGPVSFKKKIKNTKKKRTNVIEKTYTSHNK